MKETKLGPWGCKCQTLRHRITGDGCDMCNPELAKEIEQNIAKQALLTADGERYPYASKKAFDGEVNCG